MALPVAFWVIIPPMFRPLTRRRFIRLATLAPACAGICGFVHPGFALQDMPDSPTAAERKAVEELAINFLNEFTIPGMSVAFAHQGRLAFASGYGLAEVHGRQPVTTEN